MKPSGVRISPADICWRGRASMDACSSALRKILVISFAEAARRGFSVDWDCRGGLEKPARSRSEANRRGQCM